jgi:hypothetical protein
LGPLQYFACCPSGQASAGYSTRFRPRCCLLKGCGRLFRPSRPQCRYCSDTCRRQAKKWWSWQAAGKWRRSQRGRECRRAQSRRYRRLIPLPVLAEPPTAEPTIDPALPAPVDAVPVDAAFTDAVPVDPVSADAPATAREGQRPATISQEFEIRACQRPGCYELFGVPTSCSRKRFCCIVCCKALGRVVEREGRYQQRRRAGIRPRCRRSRPAPKPRE